MACPTFDVKDAYNGLLAWLLVYERGSKCTGYTNLNLDTLLDCLVSTSYPAEMLARVVIVCY